MLNAPLLTVDDQVILSQGAHHNLASAKEASCKRVSLSINVFLKLDPQLRVCFLCVHGPEPQFLIESTTGYDIVFKVKTCDYWRMFFGRTSQELHWDRLSWTKALLIYFFVVKNICEVFFDLSLAFNSPVVKTVFAVVKGPKAFLILFLRGFFIHLQFLEHVAIG